eukprot:1607544-Prymnesium_polylepis.1
MDHIAEQIVTKARMTPLETGVALECNGVVIAKVAVTGGIGFEVRIANASLLFPYAEVNVAAECFLTTACTAPGAAIHDLAVRHTNGISLLSFDFVSIDQRTNAEVSVVHILKQPPLCTKTATVENSTEPFDAQGLVGWNGEM